MTHIREEVISIQIKNKAVLGGFTALALLIGGLGGSMMKTIAANAADTSTTATTSTMPAPHFKMRGEHLGDMATKFGMTETELKRAIDSGKPIYQIAAEHGVTYAKEQAERMATLKTQLDDMVKVKYMTQAEADAAYDNAKDSPMVGFEMGDGPHSPDIPS